MSLLCTRGATRRLMIAALAGASAALAVVPAGASAADASRCAPVGGLKTTDVATARTATSLQTTEYWGPGAYRVNVCSTRGVLLRSQDVAPVAVPGGQVVSLPVATFQGDTASATAAAPAGTQGEVMYADPTDPAFVKQWATSGAATLSAVLPPTQAVSPRGTSTRLTAAVAARARRAVAHVKHAGTWNAPKARAAAYADSCSNIEYHYTGPQIYTGYYPYNANLSAMPHGTTDLDNINAGHATWNDTYNDCGWPDVTSINAAYAGTTSAVPHTYADGVNVVDFGDIGNLTGGCGGQVTGVLACTLWTTNEGVYFSGIDQRYSTAYSWSDAGAAGYYDVWSIAAHESGHAVGLAHANSSDALTMYYQAGTGEIRKRTLALGDAVGLRCRYGVTAGGC